MKVVREEAQRGRVLVLNSVAGTEGRRPLDLSVKLAVCFYNCTEAFALLSRSHNRQQAIQTMISMHYTIRTMSVRITMIPLRDEADSYYDVLPHCKADLAVFKQLSKFFCALTNKVPREPVYMADGSIVEKEAGEEYIADAEKTGKPLRSLNSSKFMSKALKPAGDVSSKIQNIKQDFGSVLSLEMDALNGDVDAMKRLASWYRDGKFSLPKDKAEHDRWMIEMHKRKAELGDTTSMNKLGKWYLSGRGPFNVMKDLEQSYHWYMTAAEAGNVVGLCNASKCLLHGWGVEKNVTHGISLLVSAAEGGLDEASLRLGYYYLRGQHGLLENKRLAKHWLQKVVDGKCRYRTRNRKESAVVTAKKVLDTI